MGEEGKGGKGKRFFAILQTIFVKNEIPFMSCTFIIDESPA